MKELLLKELKPSDAIVIGPEYAIKLREDGRVFITSKKQIDKLFNIMGYKSLYVIKILEEYAGQTIQDIGDIGDNRLYLDEETDSFIIVNKESISWFNSVLKQLEDVNCEIVRCDSSDNYYTSYQMVVENKYGSRFALYFNLLEEKAELYALHFTEEVLDGLSKEGEFLCEDGVTSISELMASITAPVDISVEFTLDTKMSEAELVELFAQLGYLTKKKKKYVTTELLEEEITHRKPLVEYVLEEYSMHSWLQQHIHFPNTTFKECCDLISERVDLQYKDFNKFYAGNRYEQSDWFAYNF